MNMNNVNHNLLAGFAILHYIYYNQGMQISRRFLEAKASLVHVGLGGTKP